MFFDLVSRNSSRSRKENGLFFASLLISVIAFYIILSLSQQDVIKFLMKMESDAVKKLVRMIPLFYGMTLIILFFLVYFASKYQLERRRHEFGMYLMLGMRRSRLFLLLLAEDVRSSVFVLAIGLPSAVLLSELISLVTARLAGLGIIGHRLNISLTAILWTAIGFALIKLAAFMILSRRIAGEEIGDLLNETPDGTKKELPSAVYALALLTGIILLAAAYAMAICGFSWNRVSIWDSPCCQALPEPCCFFRPPLFSGIACRSYRPQGKASCLHLPSAAGKRNSSFPFPCHQLAADSGGAMLLRRRSGNRAVL